MEGQMLRTAVRGGLPIIAVTSRDTLDQNVVAAIQTLTGVTPHKWDPKGGEPNKLYYMICPAKQKGGPAVVMPGIDTAYAKMIKVESSLIVVNPPYLMDSMFAAGELQTPRKCLYDLIFEITGEDAKTNNLLQALGGVTIKEATELACLTMARDGGLSANGLIRTRKSMFQAQAGLTLIDTQQAFYEPSLELEEWCSKELPFFTNGSDPRLTPRGLLMAGPPGTGKTASAKYLAEKWGVPLYRVDIAGTKSKYVGESEASMLANLQRLDHEAPCIALFDEIEKIFGAGTSDTSGTTSSMMSQLLWWMAEHTSKVLVVMTTNDVTKLPPELYRERRIDKVMHFNGLMLKQAVPFAKGVLKTFQVSFSPDKITAALTAEYKAKKVAVLPQAAITEIVYGLVKSEKIAQGGKG